MDSKKVPDDYGIILGKDDDSKQQQNISAVEDLDFDMQEVDKHIATPTGKPITKSMLISEIIENHPEIVPEIMNRGMHCIGCGASNFETLEEGFLMHGMDTEDINRTINELNKIILKKSDNQLSNDTHEYFS